MEAHELKSLNSDPCLFIGKGNIIITYVDGLLIYAQRQEEIDNLILKLQSDKCKIHKEGTAEGYLGLQVTQDGNKMTLL